MKATIRSWRYAMAGLMAGLIMLMGQVTEAAKKHGIQRLTKRLHIKVLGYNGWKMEVIVTNSSGQAQYFNPDGLYFIPTGPAEKAPQRLAASGPFYLHSTGKWRRYTNKIKIAAKSRKKLRLEVFCLDRHRASPKNGQGFSLASKRLPKSLRRKFRKNSRRYLKKYKSRSSFRGANQSMIWNIRNKKWIKLEGERKNEYKSVQRRRHRQYRRIRYRRIFRRPNRRR